MILETVCVGPMQVNCYILASADNSSAIIIDPGDQERKIRSVLARHSLAPGFIINTHGHYDHIGCDDVFGVPVYVHKDDVGYLSNPQLNLSGVFALGYHVASGKVALEDKQLLTLDDIELVVMHLPGHTPGGIALVLKKPAQHIAFTGDTLFCQGIGRSDLSGGNEVQLVKSIRQRLFCLPDDTIIYPGHGPSSTIGEEKRSNIFLS